LIKPETSRTPLVCISYSATHDLKRAIAEHTAALALAQEQNDRHWESFSELDRGKTWEAMGEQAKAESDYRAAIRADRSDVYAYKTLAQFYGSRGKRDLALATAVEEVTNTDDANTACKDLADLQANNARHSLSARAENAVRLVCGGEPLPP
jgi:tetratricopeptide (TPR) repeat protein